jgi:AhpD family alkylhydroperoxidase
MTEAKKYYEEGAARMLAVKSAVPDAVRGFGTLFQAVMKEGQLSVREKEHIAVGIGIALRCESCVYAHVQKAINAGSTRPQVMEVAQVAVMMQGGPAYTFLPVVVEALDALEAM